MKLTHYNVYPMTMNKYALQFTGYILPHGQMSAMAEAYNNTHINEFMQYKMIDKECLYILYYTEQVYTQEEVLAYIKRWLATYQDNLAYYIEKAFEAAE